AISPTGTAEQAISLHEDEACRTSGPRPAGSTWHLLQFWPVAPVSSTWRRFSQPGRVNPTPTSNAVSGKIGTEAGEAICADILPLRDRVAGGTRRGRPRAFALPSRPGYGFEAARAEGVPTPARGTKHWQTE